jgi:hypothetical protein
MNATTNTLDRPAGFAAAWVVFVLLAVAALFAAPALRAEVRVGVSLGVELPRGYADVRVGRDHYYEHRGVFYQRGPRGYVVVHAPRGAILRTLPPHCSRIYVGTSVFYRYGEVYYQPVRDGYVVVEQPRAESLPPPPPTEEYQSVWVGPVEYLFKDGQFFSKTPDGMVWTQAPLGALTKTLPTDAQSVWYQGVEYFDSDDVYFRKTQDGYQVVAAPWKK